MQVTLLNPLGMVVRMFVVPYDYRDMPNMSTTFIRQRILAHEDSIGTTVPLTPHPTRTAPSSSQTQAIKIINNNKLTNAEQMKLLRYVVHLR